MLAVLAFWDLVLLMVIFGLFTGGSAIYSAYPRSDMSHLRRVEAKLDLLLNQSDLHFQDPSTPDGLSADVKTLANGGKKLAAVKLHKRETGVTLREAKNAVESYQRAAR